MFITERLARMGALHPWRMVSAWAVAIVLAAAAVGLLLSSGLTTEGHVTNNPDSLRGYEVIAKEFPQRDGFDEFVVFRSETLRVDSPRFRERVEGFVAEARGGGVAEAATFYATGDESLVSRDRRAMLVPLRLQNPGDEHVESVVALVEKTNAAGFHTTITGTFTTELDFNKLSQHDLEEGELKFGLPAAMIVLVLVFGALVSAFLPLLLAIVSIVVALGLTALVAQGWDLSVFVINMLTGMGLALGIDYALFVVSRFREERAEGREKVNAIASAGATASRAVLFSGSAYVVAMVGLLLVPSTIMRSLAAGAILVGIVSVAAALTLLPAVLSLLGDRANALRVPVLGRRIMASSGSEGRFWGGIVRRVMARPALSLTLAVGLLLAAAAPVLTMHIGAAGAGTLPDRLATKQGLLAIERSFPTVGADPAQIVVQGQVREPRVRQAIARLRDDIRRDRGFGEPTLTINEAGTAALVRAPLGSDPLSDRAVEAVERLRAEHVPAAGFADENAVALVTGVTAENIDYFAVMRTWLPIVLLFVLGLSFVLLTVAFRSVVVAGTAIGMNLLSIGAAYGLLVLVFQHGVGAGLFGFQQVETIEAWVPLFLFAVLFGLSMDYQVFLLSRIRERFVRHGETGEAVAYGIGSTARLITGAALIIVAVFSGFAAGDLVMFQQMGFGIAVALLIDATVIRSVVVPAAMQLLGERNWYLPSWLSWIPHLEIEGEEPPAQPAVPSV